MGSTAAVRTQFPRSQILVRSTSNSGHAEIDSHNDAASCQGGVGPTIFLALGEQGRFSAPPAEPNCLSKRSRCVDLERLTLPSVLET